MGLDTKTDWPSVVMWLWLGFEGSDHSKGGYSCTALVNTHIVIFWFMTTCSLVGGYRRSSGGTRAYVVSLVCSSPDDGSLHFMEPEGSLLSSQSPSLDPIMSQLIPVHNLIPFCLWPVLYFLFQNVLFLLQVFWPKVTFNFSSSPCVQKQPPVDSALSHLDLSHILIASSRPFLILFCHLLRFLPYSTFPTSEWRMVAFCKL
jgi:hypothetical protein